MTKSFGFNTNITYLINSSDPNSYATEHKYSNCTIENSKFNKDYIYYNCSIPFANISNISEISFWHGKESLGGEVYPSYLISAQNNLVEFTKELYVLNLTKEIEEKHGQFILKGEMHKNLIDNEEFKILNADMNGTLNCQRKSELFYECKFLPTSLMNTSIDNKGADSPISIIYIVGRFIKNNFIEYPKLDSSVNSSNSGGENATIISIGNFNKSSSKEDAKGKIYLKCGNYALKYLKDFIRFYVDINYNPRTNLRILESTEKIEVIGTKNLTEISKGIVSYDLIYKNTTNKTIVKIFSPRNISFSDNDTFIGENNEMNIKFNKDENYEFLEEEEKKYESIYLSKNGDNYDAIINSDSFSFGFDTQDDILYIENNSDVEVSYKPINEERYFDKCNIENNGNQSYSIKCSPKRSVYALMNSLRIDITNLLNKKILRSASARILQVAPNTTLIPDVNSQGVINYTYVTSDISRLFPSKKSNGLSGGAIAGIIIASIVVILAIVFLIIFCNRSSGSVVKNNSVIKIPDSSTNINN